MNGPEPRRTLTRELRLPGATLMGLGAILGTGVFVSIGLAAAIAGPAVVLATALAALVATCNALSSAQLAANYPVSGGTYEYGYRLLSPLVGFIAGWMFLCAKSASAATAALGFSGYLLNSLELGEYHLLRVTTALATVVVLTLVVLGGMRRSNRANRFIVAVTVSALLLFCATGVIFTAGAGKNHFAPFFHGASPWEQLTNLLQATALMFVAFTGYGRIATLGEEVREPRQTIPRAILLTLIISTLLYCGVGIVAVAAAGSDFLYAATRATASPLETVAEQFGVPGVKQWVAIGAMTAMLGVLLNLVLGLSRVVLAMARHGDLPRPLARLDARNNPCAAILAVAVLIGGLAAVGDIHLTWSFSAFTVLIYYAITNLAALRLARQQRLYRPLWAWLGLATCLFLAFWVEWQIWLTGLALIAGGVLWHVVVQRWQSAIDEA